MKTVHGSGYQWLEFTLFAPYPFLRHAFYLQGGEDFGVRPQLVHGTRVQTVDSLYTPLGCDGATTQVRNLPLITTAADCQLIFLYDPVVHAIGNLHVGWRGGVAGIISRGIDAMQKAHKSQVKDLVVGISPSLGPRHAEFIHYRKEFPEKFWKFKERGSFFNLWELSVSELLQCGVQEKNIEVAGVCTYSGGKSFHSYRRDRTTSRHLGVICLR